MNLKTTTSLFDLIQQLDAIISSYPTENVNLSDGLRNYLNGIKQAKHLAENLLNKEL
jgi:exonuclease VII small subunit